MRGYFEIGVYHPKYEQNVGTLWRTAYTFGAAGIFTVGRRYKKQASDTLKSWRHIPLRHHGTYEEFLDCIPFGAQLVCVEITQDAVPLWEFNHPERAVYLLGAEDHGIPKWILERGAVVRIPSPRPFCLNVAVTGSIVMWDRGKEERD